MTNISIGERLKAARRAAGLSQKDLALAVGITSVSYSTYETGARAVPLAKLADILRVLDVSADWVLGLIGNRETDRMLAEATGQAPAEPTGQTLSIQAADDSCAPLINQGDMVAYIPKEAKDGELVCAVASGRPVFGRLIGDIIVPANPAFPVIREYALLGPAYLVIKKIQ